MKQIQDFKVGDRILSYNIKRGELELDEVTEVLYHPTNSGRPEWAFVQMKLDNNAGFQVTRNHPFMMEDGTWRKVRDLEVGDRVLDMFGRPIEVRYISEPLEYQPTYNFKVKKNHNYIANGMIVSNGCGCGHGGKG